MDNYNDRILLLVKQFSEGDPIAQGKADATYLRINNTLIAPKQMMTANGICNYCKENKEEIAINIRQAINGLTKKSASHNKTKKSNSILNGIEKKKLRILLYPGNREDIADLKINEATHNMIIQFRESKNKFRATEPHGNFPIFYQMCDSEDTAILYIESLLVDACMCHYIGVSDAALHHDDKQNISKEKVEFLVEICNQDSLNLTGEAKELIKYVCSQIDVATTPYISFLSIFTIASADIKSLDDEEIKTLDDDIMFYYNDYFKLWQYFRKWYYNKHGKLFSKEEEIVNPVETIFYRNTYKGQISTDQACSEMKKKYRELIDHKDALMPEKTHLYAFVVLTTVPKDSEKQKICDSLFTGIRLHQAKWEIVAWNKLTNFEPIREFITIVPFLFEI